MTRTGEIAPFQPGVGMIASKLGIPVVPIRIEGMDRVLDEGWKMAGREAWRSRSEPRFDLTGDDYLALARQVEDAVRHLLRFEQFDLLLRSQLGFARRA